MMPMLAVAEVAASVAVAAASVVAACMPDAFTAALEGFMEAAVAMRDVHTPPTR
jgi:hypothetical protein